MGGGRGNLGFAQNTSIIPQKKAILKQHDPQVQVSQYFENNSMNFGKNVMCSLKR